MTRRSFLLFALVLVLMLSVSSVALAENQQTSWKDRLTLNTGGGYNENTKLPWSPVPNLTGQYDAAANTLTYYLIAEPSGDNIWDTDPNGNKRLRIFTKLSAPILENGTTIGAALPHYFHYDSNGWKAFGNGNPIYVNSGQPIMLDVQYREDMMNNGQILEEQYMIQWMDNVDNKIVLKEETITIKVVPTFNPTNIPYDRIIPAENINRTMSDGRVNYSMNDLTNATSVTTQVIPVNGAVRYILDSGEKQDIPSASTPPRKISLNTSVPSGENLQGASYTIKWYNDSDILISTETLAVGFTPAYNVEFTSIPTSWIQCGPLEGVNYTMPNGNLGTNDVIEIKSSMTSAQWEQAFYRSDDAQSVSYPFTIKLPENALEFNIVGTDKETSDDEFLRVLDGLNYYNFNNDEHLVNQPAALGSAAYDGTTLILIPENMEHSYGIKWIDENGVEHFHRINYTITHASLAAHKYSGAAPSTDRITLNADKNVTIDTNMSGYADSVVTYYIDMDNPPQEITTGIAAPSSDITGAILEGNDFNHRYENGTLKVNTPANSDRLAMSTVNIYWIGLDENGYEDILKTEVLTIVALPKSQGTWLDNYWAPAEAARCGVDTDEYAVAAPHISYDANTGRFTFKVNPNSELDMNLLTSSEKIFYITPPTGAKYVTAATWHSPMYGKDFAEETKDQLDNATPKEIAEGANVMPFKIKKVNDEFRLYFGFGAMFSSNQLSGTELTIYTVNETMAGYSNSIHVQWYDKNKELIKMDDVAGEYVHLIKEPYMEVSETGVLTQEPTGPVLNATAVVKDGSSDWHNKELRCEIPLQEQNGGEYTYAYMKLTLWDENGNEVKLESGTKLTIYIPYPDGITHQNANKYEFNVLHYLDESNTRSEELKVRTEGQKGIAFDTESLSPFLIGYKAVETSDGGNGGSGSGNSGGSSSSGSGSKLPSVVTPSSAKNVEVPLGSTASMSISASRASSYQWYIDRNDGKGFVAIPGANDSSYTTSPVEAKNSGYRYFCRVTNSHGSDDSPIFTLSIIGMEIPKTGDMSLLFPALLFAGTALLGRRNKKTK